MIRARGAWLAVLLACTAALLAGCGGGSEDEPTSKQYGAQLRAVMADVEAAYGDTGGADGARSSGQVVERLETIQVGLRDAASRLDEITAPDELADAHEQLVSGVRDMAAAVDLRIEAEQLATTEPERAEQLAREFASDDSFQRVQAAAARITEAGVDAGL